MRSAISCRAADEPVLLRAALDVGEHLEASAGAR